MHIVTTDEMRALEAQAARDYGLTSPILMENAGKSAAQILTQQIIAKDHAECMDYAHRHQVIARTS